MRTRRTIVLLLAAAAVLGVVGNAAGSPTADTTPPSAPTGLTATKTQSSLAFSWNASTDNVGIKSYTMWVNGAWVGTSTTRSYTVSGLSCGTSRTFKVAAYDTSNNLSPSVSLTETTTACSAPPPPPPPPSSCSGVSIAPGASIQAAVNANASGTTFCIRAGVHRLTQAVSPKTNQKFVGEPGAVVSGAKNITSQFVVSGSYWVASNQTQRNPERVGQCWPSGETACQYAEDVFLDDTPLYRVMSLAALSPGEFYFDYGASKIYIANNPAGRKVEAAVATRAFVGSGSGVTIRGLVVEKFANEAGVGAIWAGDNWVIENNEVRFNHGVGVRAGQIIRGNYIHHNLQIGIRSMSTSGQLVENNEIAYNTYGERFHSYQDTGGGKLSKTLNLTVRGNYVHHNEGTGISTDWDNKGVLYENNRFEDNSFPGIIHEASYDAVIRNNVVRRNGFKVHTGSIDGSGIMISVSANVEVYGNQVERNLHGIGIKQSDRGPGAYGAHIAQNVNVHDNLVSTVANGIAAGLVGGENDPNIYCCKNLRFQSNDYVTCEPAGAKAGRWAWKRNAAGTIYISKSEWTAAGHDTTGTFATGC